MVYWHEIQFFLCLPCVHVKIMSGEMDAHIILDDPAGNSYLQVSLFLSMTIIMKCMTVKTDILNKIKHEVFLCRTFTLQTSILR